MRVEGRIVRSGKYWAVEIPMLDIYTQGRTRKDAFAMLQEAARLLADDDRFELQVFAADGERFEAAGSDPAAFFALVLRRQRQARGLSLRDVSQRLGMKSRNAYARYEQGRAVPTIQKFTELLKAVNPDVELVLKAG
jgi:predicted RNase H-like HicB family nuclease